MYLLSAVKNYKSNLDLVQFSLSNQADIHFALLLQLSLLVYFFNEKVPIKDTVGILMLVNLNLVITEHN